MSKNKIGANLILNFITVKSGSEIMYISIENYELQGESRLQKSGHRRKLYNQQIICSKVLTFARDLIQNINAKFTRIVHCFSREKSVLSILVKFVFTSTQQDATDSTINESRKKAA